MSGKGNAQIYAARAGSPSLPAGADRVARENRGGSAAAKPWGLGDPEAKRRKRIAKYKVYTVEGKVKDSLRKGLRWIKNKCSRIVHGC